MTDHTTTENPAATTEADPVAALAELDEQQQLLREQVARQDAELEQRRRHAEAAADEQRRKAAATRFAEVLDLIAANEARQTDAGRTLADLAHTDADPLLTVLTTLSECYHTRHALHLEAEAMGTTAGIPAHHIPQVPRQLPLDLLAVLLDAVEAEAKSRVPAPVPLPARGTPNPTHEEAMESERVRRHEHQLLALWLHLTEADISALTPQQRAEALTRAEAAKQQAEDEVSTYHRATELEAKARRDQLNRAGFRPIHH